MKDSAMDEREKASKFGSELRGDRAEEYVSLDIPSRIQR
jgi:hypothetical protein